MVSISKKRAGAVLVLVLLILLSGCSQLLGQGASLPSQGEVRVTYLDVGQADAICIQTSTGETALIDTGDSETRDTLLDRLKKLGVTQVDYLILTHGHADHIGGAVAVIEGLPVGHALISPQSSTSKGYQKVLAALDSHGIDTAVPSPGEAFTLGDTALTCLGPTRSNYDSLNDASLVYRMVHGEDAFLFTGDMEGAEEKDILAAGYDVSCEVLKAGHHGSKTSTSQDFLNACGPSLEAVVISVGADNSYGHPSETLLKKCKALGVPVYRTDLGGDITVKSSGSGIVLP